MALANWTNCTEKFLIVAGGGGGSSESDNSGGDVEKNGYGINGGEGASQDKFGRKGGEQIDFKCNKSAENGGFGKGGNGGSNETKGSWCGGGGGDGYYGGGGGNCGLYQFDGGGGGGSNYFNNSLKGYEGENKWYNYSGIIITRIKK